jgi:hypothetical protein
MKKMKYPTPALAGLWKKNFLRDTNKFAKSTHLEPEDYMAEFTSPDGEKWRILGAMEGKDLPCENISSGYAFIWDRWDVSLLVRSAEHAKSAKVIVMVEPEKKKRVTRKKTEEIIPESPQLSLFGESGEITDNK